MQKVVGKPPFVCAKNFGDHDTAVVIGNTCGYTSKEFKSPDMTFPEGFGAFPLKCGDKDRTRKRQRHDKEGHFPQHAINVQQSVTKIHLGFSLALG